MKTISPLPLRQRGVTLIELLVGLGIGLMVVAVAMSALMVSRGISGTVSDASNIQQQAAYIMRMMGGQLRQAGSLYLNPDPIGGSSTDTLSAVVFETNAQPADSKYRAFNQDNTIIGDATTGGLTTTFRREKVQVYIDSNLMTLARNCLSHPSDVSTASSFGDEAVESIFVFKSAENALHCGGNGTAVQPVAQNLAQFQVTYLEQVPAASGTTIKYVSSAADVTNWRRVQGVQVCLVLYGSESIDMPTGSSYIDCAGTSIDMTTLTGERKNRMHLLFRNTFQLRSQGLL